jgi:hypothetical protein
VFNLYNKSVLHLQFHFKECAFVEQNGDYLPKLKADAIPCVFAEYLAKRPRLTPNNEAGIHL